MGPGYGPPPNADMRDKLKEPRPESLKEVPTYLKNVMSKFFSRLFYIARLVWEAKPSLLLLMMFMAFFNGITPVVGSLISANLMTKLAGYCNICNHRRSLRPRVYIFAADFAICIFVFCQPCKPGKSDYNEYFGRNCHKSHQG